MTAFWPLGRTPLERRDDIASGEAAARSAPQLGTRSARDKGSWPDRAPSALRDFCEGCRIWCDWNLAPNEMGRRTAFNTWLYQHGEAWVEERWAELNAVLDGLEARIREEVRGCPTSN